MAETMTLKRPTSPFIVLLVGSCLLFFSKSIFAQSNSGIQSKISLGLGWEGLKYEEDEPDTDLDSEAELNNLVVGIEGLKRWEHFFCGAKAIFPVLLGDDQEEVTRAGASYQTDTLEVRWIRIDGFLGYPVRPWFNPYVGFRWSEFRQERTNFEVAGTSIDLRAVEKVKSWNLLLGVRGVGAITPRLGWNYHLEFFVPLDVEVTNSALSGFEASDRDGHALELKTGIDYSYTESILFGFTLYGGWVHWDGSDWKPFDGGLAKWPENDTYYLGAGLNVSYQF
jgi:hypothetical protein